MPGGQKNQNIEQKQYCNRFNKYFKNGTHKKKKNLKKKSKTPKTNFGLKDALGFLWKGSRPAAKNAHFFPPL